MSCIGEAHYFYRYARELRQLARETADPEARAKLLKQAQEAECDADLAWQGAKWECAVDDNDFVDRFDEGENDND